MTATMTAPAFGSTIQRSYGTPLREILHPEQVAAETAAHEAAIKAAEDNRAEAKAARETHDQAIDELESNLPPIGTIIRTKPGIKAALHKSKDIEKPGLLVRAWVVDEFPTVPYRALFGNPEERSGLLCFLSNASYQKLHDATYGYLEYAEVHAVKVIGHAKNGRSIRVEVVE